MQRREYMATTTINCEPSPADTLTRTSRDVRARIEQSLHRRSAPPGTSIANIEAVVKRGATHVWRAVRKRPSIGIVLVGSAGVALATVTGVGELTIGLLAAYGAYQVLREGLTPEQAAENFLNEIEHTA